MSSNHGPLKRDLIGGTLRVNDKLIVDKQGNITAKSIHSKAITGEVKDDLIVNGNITGNITGDFLGSFYGDIIVDSALVADAIARSPFSLEPTLLDAFGRQKVSNPFTLIDNKFLTTTEPEHWDTIVNGSASYTFTPGKIALNVTGSGDKIIRQTRFYTPYQPGKGLTILATGTLEVSGGVNGVISKIGYFDDETDKIADDTSGGNGYYFELNGTALSLVERTDANGFFEETRVPQSSWNVDPFNGTGPSGITIDPSKRQIFFIELEWLGTGTAVMGFFMRRKLYMAHIFYHANVGGTGPYISRPTLPIRYELSSTGGTAEMIQICSTAISDGGYDPRGGIYAKGGSVGNQVTVNSGVNPLIAIRLRPGFRRTALNILKISSYTESNGNYIIRVF